MIIVGLTGGIGSGKTTIAKQFVSLGIPVYIADEEAKKLMTKSKVIKRKLIQLFGNEVYIDNQLNKKLIANIIFNDKSYLQRMNTIVHPKVANHFKSWVLKQQSPYVIKEVAILFENDGYKQCDFTITVVAPKALRIERLLKRDATTKANIEAIMKNQWTDDEKIKLSNYVIHNINIEEANNQVIEIHNKILKQLSKSKF